MSAALRVGIDVGGTRTKLVGVDAQGTEVGQGAIATPSGDIDRLVSDIAEVVPRLFGRPEVDEVGIGSPGAIDRERGDVAHAVNLGIGGDPYPLGPAIAEALGTSRWAIDNDVAATGLAATRALPADHPGRRRCAYLNLGTGFSAALVDRGQLVRANGGSVCEVGHVSIDPEGRHCPCGGRGCLETAIGAPALERLGQEAGWESLPAMFAAAAGDNRARKVVSFLAGKILLAIHWISAIFGLDAVLLGGGIATISNPVLTEEINARIASTADRSPVQGAMLPTAPVEAANPSDMLGAYGALELLAHRPELRG